jgi:hypothetical protein
LTDAAPVVDGVKLAVQVAVPAVAPAERLHGEPVNEPVAVPDAENATVPVGVEGEAAISVTVAVQVEA